MRRRISVLAVGLALLLTTGCSAGASATAGASPSGPATPERTTAVFLGDSYTAISHVGRGYALETAAALGWIPVLAAQGGTGYLAGGDEPDYAPYEGRLPQVAAAEPDVVLVQGSTNDIGRPVGEIEGAASALYAALAGRLPGARLVVLGPLSPPSVDPVGAKEVSAALRRAAETADIPYIDPIAEGWLTPADGLYADALHPNDAGYRELTRDLVASLHEQGF